ncbi:type I-E CRISPR-associated protein Cse1/CasA [Streptomyces syringium]|uniref:type I-E CRISPR-associated protein Cse1/CasA n=1 Tax=Streptomyces syringium TaxID=76729 RepID=UPI0037D68803
MPSYLLTTQPWIPVGDLTTGDYREVGLTEALTRAHELTLAARPGQEHAVLLRVLLAAYDAAAGPASWTDWTQAWQAPTLDTSRLTSYLETWADRLDLYHPQRPAFQAGGLTDYPRAHTTLHPAYLGGESGVWFNRGHLTSQDPIEAAQAVRYLLARTAYDVAGIKGGVKGGRTYGSWLGPLAPVTHLSLTARTLKDELLLNLPPAPRSPGDMPVWERPEDLPLTPGARTPVPGRLAWWTWPARLLRLKPDDGGGVVAVAWHDGLRPETSTWEAAQAHDPMTAWTGPDHRLTPTTGDPYLPAWFPGRAVLGGTAVLDHAARAAADGALPADLPLRLTVSWASYNVHKSVMTDEQGGTASLGTAALLADPVARRQMAAAAHFAQNIPRSIRSTLKRNDETGTLLRSSDLALSWMDQPWEQMLRELADARGETKRGWRTVRTWRDTVQEQALDLFDRQVRARRPDDKLKASLDLVRHLDGIPLNALSADQEAQAELTAPAAAPRAEDAPAQPPATAPASPAPAPAPVGGQAHLLAPHADDIDPEQLYTVRQIAGLTGLAVTSVYCLSAHGYLPGGRWDPKGPGGGHCLWTGEELLAMVSHPPTIVYDHDAFAPATLWRVGCRCDRCTDWHNATSKQARRQAADDRFPTGQRRQVLENVAAGMAVADAAQLAGVTLHQVYGRATRDAQFAEALDEATWALCVLGPTHPQCGTATAYSSHSGPPCRGTGCREWRRGASRQERAATEPPSDGPGTASR